MAQIVLNQLGEWNPQLFRELKGQLKRRNVFILVASSIVSQFFILILFSQHNCINYSGNDCAQLNWDIQWQMVFKVLNWMLPLLLLFCGVYQLISDLGKEGHRGTLNFIRLSPQSSQSILTGKVLGVPTLLYLGVALAIPLHLVSALAVGVPLFWILGTYTLWAAGCCLCYSAALLIAVMNRAHIGVQAQAWGGSFLAGLFGLFYISVINSSFDLYQSESGLGNWQWFLLPLGQEPVLGYVWMLITVSVGTYWIWQSVNRLFRNPNTTLLSKTQSYRLVGSFQAWLLGSVLPELNSVYSDSQLSLGCAFLFVLNPILFLLLNAALSPNRQSIRDWARYRRKSNSSSKGFLNRALMQDLIRGEKSPALFAIAINLLITATIWVPWILLLPHEVWHQENFGIQQALLGLLLTMNLILIYAAFVELMVYIKKSQQALWITGTLGALIILPLVFWGVLGIEPLKIMSFLCLFSPLPVLALIQASFTTIFLGLLAQWGVLGVLTLQLTRQIKKTGESSSKALFARNLSLPSGGLK